MEETQKKNLTKTKHNVQKPKKRNFFYKTLRETTTLIGCVGFIGALDYLGGIWKFVETDGASGSSGFIIDHPMVDIAIGSGINAGLSLKYRSTYGMITSLMGLGISIYPNLVSLGENTDLQCLIRGVAGKVFAFGAATFISSLESDHREEDKQEKISKRPVRYDGFLQLDADLGSKIEADRLKGFLESVVNSNDEGSYINPENSLVGEIIRDDNIFRLNAKIYGKSSNLESELMPKLNQYKESLKTGDIFVSPVVKTSEYNG